jgi:GT2 family glycosyltransferase
MKISIVIVEYNSLDELQRCAESLQKGFSCEVELISSSNSCYQEERRGLIQSQFPQFKWSFNEKNGGFAYAMNQGLKLATGDYLIIANPDCVFIDELDEMLTFLQKHPEVGAIAPQIVDENGHIQDSCRHYISVQSFIWRQVRRKFTGKEVLLNSRTDYNKIQTVDWVIGAFIMVSRAVYEKTGGLSDDYFMYAEDMDWCTRIRLAGWEVVYYPKVKIQYKGTRSARKNTGSAKIFLNSLKTYWKKFGFFFGYPKRKKIEY